ncbi:MAG: dimethylmenaquinone methyltransferase [Mucilaginibacter sp.]|nr:dimethylmenaquinone methyltransferase [Mucilaginibacter sp.]
MITNKTTILLSFIFCVCLRETSSAQTIPKEELTFLTSQWKGERFADGRPKVSDDLIARAKNIGLDDAWTALKNLGYVNQFEGGWKTVNNEVITGRAVTAMFMPTRPDVEKNIKERGVKQGHAGNTNAWPIDVLIKGDVYVADGFGKVAAGTLMGSTLGNSIFSKTGNGVIFDASARDVEGLSEIKGFNAFVRDFHPSFLESEVLMGLNTPIRIGGTIVLPGDLVLAKREGVLFIPAQLAEQVVTTAEFVTLKDDFGFEMVKTGRFKTGQIDSEWTPEVKQAFYKWVDQHKDKVKMSRETIDKILEKRTW